MAKIVDYLGRDVEIGNLTNEIATPSVSGIRQSFHDGVTSGLTPTRLGAILAAIEQGDATEYLTLAEEMETKDSHYSSVLRTRKLAVSGLKITVEAASDDPRDVELADEAKALTRRAGFRPMLKDLLDAYGKGYSATEIDWDKTGKFWTPKKYTHRDPRFFNFDRATGQELRLKDEKDLVNGLALEPYKFIVHLPQFKTGLPIRGGLALLACVPFMCKSFTLSDWMTFAEIFGMPLRLGKYATGATSEQKAALLRAVTNIGSDAAAIIPEGMLIEFVNASSSTGGEKLFSGLADWLDRQVSKAVLGQTSTSDAQPTGIGSGVADNANEVRHDIRDDDALTLAATIQRDLIKPFIDLNWGPQENYPTLIIGAEKKEDLETLGKALTPFVDRGMRVGVSVIRDKFGIEEPGPDEEVLKPQGGSAPFGFNPPAPADNQGDNLAQAKRRATIALMQRVVNGEELTADQRALVTMLASDGGDELDKLADESLNNWRDVMDPVTDPIIALANKAKSFDDLLADLDGAKLDTSELIRTVATLTFQARGRGDVTDL